MRLALFAAVAMLAACSRPAAEAPSAETPSIEAATADAASTVERYAPMAAFAPFSGKTFRGEWTDENGERLVDFAKWELILNGRALQSTHRLEGKDYGGRTIFFYDEGAKNYVFHYFTTAGFHTTGTSDFVDDGLVTEEKVEGHDSIGSVRSKVTFGADAIEIDVVYVGKDGSETPGGHRVYTEIADPGRLFADTE
ncbi:MAG TPA: hypothetical protein PKM48_07585 [Parvularculaceae bacterium]|nr:hypothetical protein [Parvularculaceae bacterium]HNS87272.1 hypothetical protein [Parvularculaceae bacterium]